MEAGTPDLAWYNDAMEQPCYRISQPTVIAEVIDDVAIIVNLNSGAYNTQHATRNILTLPLANRETRHARHP